MKLTTTTLSTLLFVALLSSCGQSEEEKAKLQQQQQAREDSIKSAVEDETKHKLENIHALKDSLEKTNMSHSVYQANLMDAKANLEAAKDKMNSIKEFEFGRAASEREDQIKSQSMVITSLEQSVKDIEQQIKDDENRISQLKAALQNSN